MAAPSLQDVLAGVPAARIDAWNELIPGVQASPQNLSTLLGHIKKAKHIELDVPGNQPSIGLCLPKSKSKLFAAVKGPEEAWRPRSDPTLEVRETPVVARDTFEPTADGLLEAICWAKKGLKRLREEGTCPDCQSKPNQYPRKKLKAEGMPKCCECMLKAAVGLGS
jgi:hypothetical protein